MLRLMAFSSQFRGADDPDVIGAMGGMTPQEKITYEAVSDVLPAMKTAITQLGAVGDEWSANQVMAWCGTDRGGHAGRAGAD